EAATKLAGSGKWLVASGKRKNLRASRRSSDLVVRCALACKSGHVGGKLKTRDGRTRQGALTMATSVWKGYLTFGLISVPVRLFSAARTEHIAFNQLHKECKTRVRQPLYCPTCERMVERSEIVKGYEYEKGQYVLVEDEEIKK